MMLDLNYLCAILLNYYKNNNRFYEILVAAHVKRTAHLAYFIIPTEWLLQKD